MLEIIEFVLVDGKINNKKNVFSPFILLILCFLFSFFSTSTSAEDQHLKIKTKALAKKKTSPFSWQASYVSDTWYDIAGGLRHHGNGAYLGLLDLQLNMQIESLFKIGGTSGLIEVQNLHTQRPDLFIHSLQGFDNIEDDRVSTMTYLYQFWLKQKIGETWSFLGGFYDINSEFYVTDSSQYLILPALGLGTELALTGLNGPSTYPATGIALRIKATPTPKIYIQGATFDAGVSNPFDRISPNLPFSTGQGTLNIIEVGRLFLDNKTTTGKIAVGAWIYSHQIPIRTTPQRTGFLGESANKGFYTLLDYPLYINSTNKTKVIHGFLRWGQADESVNFYDRALGTGFMLSGFIPGRPKDLISFGLAPAWASQDSILAFPGYPKAEWQNELTYVAVINKWLTIQPDLQYIIFQGAENPLFQDAWLVGMRFTAILS